MSGAENALVEIPAKDAYLVFTTQDGIVPILDKVRAIIDEFEGDISTYKGRKEIASFAYKISTSKTALEKVGKTLTEEAKAIPKQIDANRKHMKDTLDEWRDEVRKPLSEWEEAEEKRIEAHVIKIERMRGFARTHDDDMNAFTAEQLRERLSVIDVVEVGPCCEEFEDEYRMTKDAGVSSLKVAIHVQEEAEAEAAELAQLRKDKAERESREAKEATEKKAAEEETQRQKDATERDGRIRREAEEKAEREKEETLQAERNAAAAREKKLKDAADASKKEAEEAVEKARQDEVDRVAREVAAAAKRKADDEHRTSVDYVAIAALEAGGISKDHAKLAINLISENKIPSITIQY